MKQFLQKFSITVSKWGSSTNAFILSIVVVLVWLLFGPAAGFSEKWLITITVITDVIIFIMVFSIQNTQFRDSKAIQLKLNELIAADKKARDSFIGLEELTDSELAILDDEFKQLLSQLEVHPAMHKLHQTIKQAKDKRPSLTEQTAHLVDALLSPLASKDEHQK
jgi:low affinity Fe/Cu permease